MKNLLIVFIAMLTTVSSVLAQDHKISASVNVGWAIPGGSGVTDEPEDLNLDGGLVYGVDILYHLSPNLLAGINYTSALLAGAGDGDLDLFGARMMGLKGVYQLKDSGFRPFFGLSLGLSQLLTPEYSITDGTGTTVTVPENTGSGLGIMPEVGIHFNDKFYLLVQYLVPTSYTIEEAFIDDKAMGTINVCLGYRYSFEF